MTDKISYRPRGATSAMAHKGGSVIAAHVHADDQIVYVSAGLIAVTTSNGVWSATPDRALLTPGGMWHEHRMFGNSRVHALELTDMAAFEPEADAPIVFAVDGLLRALLIELTESRIPAGLADEAKALLVGLIRLAPPAGIRLPNPRDERLARVCAMVETDLGRNISLSTLAAAVNLSERSLSRLFRTEFGATYPQWRSLVRVFHASIALLEEESITEVAARFGWATPSAFITTFTRLIGQTPSSYQRGLGL
jgi:AraC-like DNA-binding protein